MYYVYIIASVRRTIYIGVTNSLRRRVFEHKLGNGSSFTSKYNCTRLVYCESFGEVLDAIAREKELKGWLRKKKIALIATKNPAWYDLLAELDPYVEQTKADRAAEVEATS